MKDRSSIERPAKVHYSEQDELAFLGSIIEDWSARSAVIDSIRETDFFVAAHRDLFRKICTLHDAGEAVTFEKLIKNEEASWAGLLVDAMKESLPPNVSSYVMVLKRESAKRARQEELDAEQIRLNEDPTYLAPVEVSRTAKSLFDLSGDPGADPDELLKHRFLCRGGGAMINGPTGIGKSSLVVQAAILWALGRPLFGIAPARPLTSVIIQAENDDVDLIEMRDGICEGLGLSAGEIATVREKVFVESCNSKTGITLVNDVVKPLLKSHRPDLLWVDNLFAYSGCGVSDQVEMTQFLRNLINPLIQEYRCAIIFAHHTNKPPGAEQKAEWSVSETSYLGSGTNELANWPRAILSIREKKLQGVFDLVAGKRGGRLRWRDGEGKVTCRQTIAHSADGRIYWIEASDEQVEGVRPPKERTKYDVQTLLLVGQRLSKDALISKAQTIKIGINKAKGFIAELIEDGILKVHQTPRPRTNPAVSLERVI